MKMFLKILMILELQKNEELMTIKESLKRKAKIKRRIR